jgi:hypothetical protein
MKAKRTKHSVKLRRNKGSKKSARLIGEPIPHCNTYGQWVAEARWMMREAKRRK